MKTTPTCQPPGEPFDGKPRVIVVKEELEQLNDACLKVLEGFDKGLFVRQKATQVQCGH